jgi:hypothetical protein
MAPINAPFRSSSDLVLEALKNLGVLSAGNPVDPEDFSWVNEKLDSIYRKLAGLEIVYVADPNNIPGAWFSDLADIVAGECAKQVRHRRPGADGQDEQGPWRLRRCRDWRRHGREVAQDHAARASYL